jgi:hypothetical protein
MGDEGTKAQGTRDEGMKGRRDEGIKGQGIKGFERCTKG